MIARVVSGGQTGADQAGWRAAKAAGISCGGWMPAGFKTEDGPRPEFAELYGAAETASADYPERTRRNVIDGDLTIWFGNAESRGGRATLRDCHEAGRPFLLVIDGVTRPSHVAARLADEGVGVLNVAGNRESSSPGIGDRVERFLTVVFRITQREG